MEWLAFKDPVSAWSHFAWLLLSFPGGWLLWKQCCGSRVKQLSFLTYSLSMAFCSMASTLFHAVRLSAEQREVFATIDHVGIYLFIAGCITPLALILLQGWWRWGMFLLAWSIGLAGITLRLAHVEMKTLLSTSLYLGMGWTGFLCYFEMARVLSYRALLPALLGGFLYTVGAVFDLLNWPNFWPPAFRAHDLFHLFVMAGSLIHFWFMLKVVAPYERPVAIPAVEVPVAVELV